MCRYYIFYELASDEVGVTHDDVNSRCGLITYAQFQRAPDVIAASPSPVPIETGILGDADVAVEGVEKTIRLAGQPEPGIAGFKPQFLGRLQIKPDSGSFDVFINNIMVRRPGARKT